MEKNILLNNGLEMPALGFGTFKIEEDKVRELTLAALEAGYRYIDTASYYNNEKGIGDALRECGLKRSDVFISTKIWMDDLGKGKTRRTFEDSLEKLQTDYIDLYLIHWPRPLADETWKVMEQLYDEKKIKAIGVCNYTPDYLDDLIGRNRIVPAVNQIELHPGLQQRETVEYCRAKGIVVEAWSPIMKGKSMEMETLKELGNKYGKSPVQVTLRWHLQRGIIAIPKSSHPERMKANLDIRDFELTEEDMARIALLDSGTRLGFTPKHIMENGFKPGDTPK